MPFFVRTSVACYAADGEPYEEITVNTLTPPLVSTSVSKIDDGSSGRAHAPWRLWQLFAVPFFLSVNHYETFAPILPNTCTEQVHCSDLLPLRAGLHIPMRHSQVQYVYISSPYYPPIILTHTHRHKGISSSTWCSLLEIKQCGCLPTRGKHRL